MTSSAALPDSLPFRKMQGLGNDFVVIDARKLSLALTQPQLARIADRRFGVGCDQLILLEDTPHADVRMRIFNPDGGEVGACGNATRCIAALVHTEDGRDPVRIETKAGILVGHVEGREVAVDMGLPALGWAEIPLAGSGPDTLRVPFDGAAIHPRLPGWFSAVNMGNPHGIFFVEDAEAFPLEAIGPRLETHPVFPEKANISLVSTEGPNRFRVRVWERAAGITLACGTAACAVGVATWRLGLADGAVAIRLPGGTLRIDRDSRGHVIMTGPAATSFTGALDGAWLAEARG
ncbi:MAG: diaminopimelate epimerase [Beijerinckiaceae bacterium]|nr:diaminopimelate epimerase [Beijerinckiaceae bacterium]